jgi:hypothetical protein
MLKTFILTFVLAVAGMAQPDVTVGKPTVPQACTPIEACVSVVVTVTDATPDTVAFELSAVYMDSRGNRFTRTFLVPAGHIGGKTFGVTILSGAEQVSFIQPPTARALVYRQN